MPFFPVQSESVRTARLELQQAMVGMDGTAPAAVWKAAAALHEAGQAARRPMPIEDASAALCRLEPAIAQKPMPKPPERVPDLMPELGRALFLGLFLGLAMRRPVFRLVLRWLWPLLQPEPTTHLPLLYRLHWQ